MKRFENKVALVTGGLGGFGLAIAQRLLKEGANVVLGDIGSTPEVPQEMRVPGQTTISVKLDVTQPSSWAEVVESTVAQFGHLDLLVNNAGITSPRRFSVDEVTPEEWRRVHSVSLDGTFFGIQAALRVMKAQPSGGAIVNVCSISRFTSIENHESYSTSKSAVRGLTRHAALSCAKLGYNVRINAVHPGTVWTPLLSQKWTERLGSEEAAKSYLHSLTPAGQAVEPSDIASAVAFLGSDDARRITGSELVVDAGQTLVSAAKGRLAPCANSGPRLGIDACSVRFPACDSRSRPLGTFRAE